MSEIFISYARSTATQGQAVAAALRALGYGVWIDDDLPAHRAYGKVIQEHVTAAKAVVVLWSLDAAESEWVLSEAEQAREARKLVQATVDGMRPPMPFDQVQCADLKGWTGDVQAPGWRKVVASVAELAVADRPHAETPVVRATVKKRWFGVAAAAIAIGALALFVLQSGVATRTQGNADGRIEIDAFEPVTQTDELKRFAKGMTDTVVRVFTTNDIKAVAAVEANPSSAAEFTLRGSVDRDGDQFVASVDLLHRREGRVLWSTTMQRDATQIRILEDQFSTSVAMVLTCALQIRHDAKNDPSPDLFGRMLGICAAIADGRFDQMPELARRFVEAAPQYAVSYGWRAAANAIVSRIDVSGVANSPQELARLRKMVYDDAQIVEEMEPSADSYYARAIVDDPSVGIAARERLLQKSIEVAPGRDGGMYAYGKLLFGVGRFRDALDYFERATHANPLQWGNGNEAARAMACAGNADLARKRFGDLRKAHSSPLIDWMQFWTELRCGDPAIAKAISETYVSSWYGWVRPTIATASACGRTYLDARVRDLRLTKSEIDAVCPEGDTDLYDLYGYFGYVDESLHLWEADAGRTPDRTTLFMPQNRLVRADPRFMHLAARFGLVDYWLDTDQWPDFCKEEKLPYDCKEAALAARAAINP